MNLEYSAARTSTASIFIKLDTKSYTIWFSNKIPVLFYRKDKDVYIATHEGNQLDMRRVKSVLKEIPQEKIKWVGIQTILTKVRKI